MRSAMIPQPIASHRIAAVGVGRCLLMEWYIVFMLYVCMQLCKLVGWYDLATGKKRKSKERRRERESGSLFVQRGNAQRYCNLNCGE